MERGQVCVPVHTNANLLVCLCFPCICDVVMNLGLTAETLNTANIPQYSYSSARI